MGGREAEHLFVKASEALECMCRLSQEPLKHRIAW